MASILTKKIIYKDINLAFQAHPDTGAVSTLINEQAITRAIKNLVFTNKYEKLFSSKIYSDVYASLFDNFDPITIQLLKNAIRDVINNYEPRSELYSISVRNDLELNGISIDITYRPINSPNVVSVNIFLERVR